jgi:hypothetical protein
LLSANNAFKFVACTFFLACHQGATCRCLPGYVTNFIGPAACGPPISFTGNASDAAALATQLCGTYAASYEKMMQVSNHGMQPAFN